MNDLTKKEIEQILFDIETQPNQLGDLIWNGNEFVFETYPNIGVAGISPNMPDKFAEEIAKRYNNNKAL